MQLDAQGREPDFWGEVVEKAVNAKTKMLLQPPFGTQKIDLRYFQGNKPAKKEKKDSGKTKSTNTLSAEVFSGKHQSPAYQGQTTKKDQDHQESSWC